MQSDGTVRTVAEGGLGPVKIASGTNGGPTLANSDRFVPFVSSYEDPTAISEIPSLLRSPMFATEIPNISLSASVGPVKIASGTNGGPTLADTDIFGGALDVVLLYQFVTLMELHSNAIG